MVEPTVHAMRTDAKEPTIAKVMAIERCMAQATRNYPKTHEKQAPTANLLVRSGDPSMPSATQPNRHIDVPLKDTIAQAEYDGIGKCQAARYLNRLGAQPARPHRQDAI